MTRIRVTTPSGKRRVAYTRKSEAKKAKHRAPRTQKIYKLKNHSQKKKYGMVYAVQTVR